MPYNYLNLQLFGEEGSTETGEIVSSIEAESPAATTEAASETQVAPAIEEESFDSLIKGKFKKEYNAKVKEAMNKRFKNQADLQGKLDALNPMIQSLSTKYGVVADQNGSIPIDELISKVLDDNSMYEQEAYERGIAVEDLKQIKSLERENAELKAARQRTAEEAEWQGIVEQANVAKEIYPEFDLDMEMQNPQFGRLLATMQRSGFPNAVQTAYEAVHRDELMGSAMRYAAQQTQKKLSNSIQSGMARPSENGTIAKAAANSSIDPTKLTKADIENIKMRAARGERITF